VRKILLGVILVVGCFLKVHAGSNVAILPSTVISKNEPVICSSTTASLVLSANSYRKGMCVVNNGSYAVRLSTFASTSQSRGIPVAVSGEFSDNIEAYSGPWYSISTGVGTSTIDVIEKQGVIYQ